MNYQEQIKDPRWQKRRLEILQLDNFTCQICGSYNKTLHIHHTIYLPQNNIWEYEDCQLITLCEDCHKNEHENLSELVKNIINDIKNQGLTNLEILFYLSKYTDPIYPNNMDIGAIEITNHSKYIIMNKLAKRRFDIDSKKYG